MERYKWQIILGASLIATSAALYYMEVLLFHNVRDTLFYLLQDIAFVPIQVLLVTLIINQLLNIREKHAMMSKMNMVIGTFFSEVGASLLRTFSVFDPQRDRLARELLVNGQWTDQRYAQAIRTIETFDIQVHPTSGDLEALKIFLLQKRGFLLGLLENPNLLEHETFTDLLWSVFHLTEELAVRENLQNLPLADGNHLSGDIKRAYVLLITEWLSYLKHLQHDYPYLFSFAVRTNPFDRNASPTVS